MSMPTPILNHALRFFRRGVKLASILTVALLVTAADSGPKFYPDDPIAVEPETQQVADATRQEIDLVYDLAMNSFAHPASHTEPARAT